MQQQQSKKFSYQTRIHENFKETDILSFYGSYFSRIKHKLYVDLIKNKDLNALKKQYIKEYQITARQFNSCRMEVEGKIKAYNESRQYQISLLKEKISNLEKHIPKLKNKLKIHQKKRKLFNLKIKLENSQKDKKPKICFGSKKLFKAQFYLEENGFKSFEEWKNKWQEARNNNFFIVGSKDESFGNQSCQISFENDLFSLKIRLPNKFSQKYLIINNLKFAYGKSEIIEAIESNLKRKKLQSEKNSSYKYFGQAISYRFVKDKKGFRVFVTIEKPKQEIISNQEFGVIGVDINVDQLAVAELDTFSNKINSKKIALNLYGKSKNQISALISEACKTLVEMAKQTKKPIVIEDLDFSKKKSTLKETNKRFARMLSSFSYKTIKNMIISKAYRAKIEVFEVNPAYTSVIGRVKFSKRYGLSKHQSAALAIGRRFMNASEKPKHQSETLDAQGQIKAFFLPERNRKKHLWFLWKEISEIIKAVDVPHFRATRC